MARLRTFLAVGLTPALRKRLAALQETLRRGGADVKWVEEENLHVTLLFLGEVDERDVMAVCRAVSGVCAGLDGFEMTLSGVGGFPNPRRPRVAWVGVGAGAAELTALHDALEPPLLELGCYRREGRQYTPHVTLGRAAAEGGNGDLGEALRRQAGWFGGTQQVREVCVMSSRLTPQGPVYAPLSRAALRRPQAARADVTPEDDETEG
jgi:2'-5' RNA ligase